VSNFLIVTGTETDNEYMMKCCVDPCLASLFGFHIPFKFVEVLNVESLDAKTDATRKNNTQDKDTDTEVTSQWD